MTHTRKPSTLRPLLSRAIAALVAAGMTAGAHAAITDISQTPLIVTTADLVKPNIMLLMDNSGSMGWTHMPDEIETVTGVKSIGYKSAQCNRLYYNPTTSYLVPKRSNGAFFATPTFGAAPYSGYVSFYAAPSAKDATIPNLATGFSAYEWGEGQIHGPLYAPTSGPSTGYAPATVGHAFYYTYAGPQTLRFDAAPCKQLDTGATVAATGGGVWTRVDMTGESADQQQNFAIWYSFYRTRLSLTKSAASLAFAPLDSSKRVGFIAVEPKDNRNDALINPARYLSLDDFTTVAGGQKEKWYRKLFSQVPRGASPAREGLARVGRYYAGKTDGINAGMDGPDPVQYACQQNFTILTTDGYWNGQTETPGRGGVDKDGIALVGQQDGEPFCHESDPFCHRPTFDGNSADKRIVTDANNNYFDVGCALGTKFRHTAQQQRQVWHQTRDTSRSQLETIQYQASSSQDAANTTQTMKTVKVTQKSIDQFKIETLVPTQDRYQVFMSQDRIARDTQQYQMQKRQQTAQTLLNTEVVTKSVAHYERWQTASVQYVINTTQFQSSEYHFEESKAQTIKHQWQYIGVNALGESSAPLADVVCPAGYTCQAFDIFPSALVDPASCPASGVSGYDVDPNLSYVHTDCLPTVNTVAMRPVPACSAGVTPGVPDVASSNNGMVTTVCNQVVTRPTGFTAAFTPATCVPSSQSLVSPYTVTTCTQTQNSSVGQAAGCMPGPPVTSGDGFFVTTQCVQPPAYNYPAKDSAPCNELAGPQTDASFVTTTCTKPIDQVDVPAPPLGPGCINTDGKSSPYTKTTCTTVPVSSTKKAFATCNNVPPVVGNGYMSTQCVQTPDGATAGAVTPVPYGSCAAGPNAGAYAYDTFCDYPVGANNQTAFAAAADCGNTTGTTTVGGFVDQICTLPNGANNTPGAAWDPVGMGACVDNLGTTPPYLHSTCRTIPISMPTAVDQNTCPNTSTSAAPPYITTHCVVQPAPGAFACPGTPASDPEWIYEVCTFTPVFTPAPFGSCTPDQQIGVNPDRFCREVTSTGPIDVCLEDLSPNGTNPQITCTGPTTTSGPTPVDPTTCPAVNGQQGGPGYLDITCVTSAAGPYLTPTPVQAGTCVDGSFDGAFVSHCTNPPAKNFALANTAFCAGPILDPGKLGNDWTTTACVKSDTTEDKSTAACLAAAHPRVGTGPEVICTPNGGDVGKPVDSCRIDDIDATAPYDTVTACHDDKATAPFVNWGPGLCVRGPSGTVGDEIDCQTIPTPGPDVVDASCVANGPDATGLITSCPTFSGVGFHYKVQTTTTVTTTPMSGGLPSGPSVVVPSTGPISDATAACYPNAQVIPSPPAGDFPAKPLVTTVAGCGAYPCTVNVPSPGGSLNSLADVAQYYYATDLRPLMADVVPIGGPGPEDDNAKHQHMTTFVLALGVSGTLQYRPDYRTALVGDFADIRTGAKDWPVWPDPLVDYTNADNYASPKSIDDFWHTAVNGRGLFFSANDPQSVIDGLGGALASVGTITASGAADAISSLTPIPGNNFVYGTSYESGTWSGELEAFTLDTVLGTLNLPRVWSAKDLLDNRVFPTCDNRRIFLMRGGALVDFAWNTDECPATGVPTGAPVAGTLNAAEKANFSPANIALLSQFTAYLPGDPQLVAAQAPGAIVNFLRGETGNEGFVAGSTTNFYRKRKSALGDLVDSQPVYVGAPFANYLDPGYAAFKTTVRPSMVYVGGNDGMLHAFYATVDLLDPAHGQEAWAVIPSAVLPDLYKLADTNYLRGNHEFFVDGTPVAADVHDGAGWHTILVGGFNAGGKGYYALDITNPAAPAALWEFKQNSGVCPGNSLAAAGNTSDCNVGLSFGKPVVTKLGGTWVVMFTSGYNNVNGVAGDGQGFLYVVDAMTGVVMHKIGTGVGGTGAGPTPPSGLAQINNYVDNVLVDNTTLRAYGGDLLGNIWRFEFPPAAPAAVLVGTATTGGGVAQPITTRPELAELNGKPFVMVGTGKLLGATDVTDVETQSVYGVTDTLAAGPVYPALRGSLRSLSMTQIGAGLGAVRTIACTANCASTNGWAVDLAEAGERVNVDMKLVLGTLAFSSNVPEGIACSVGGHSWFNQIDFGSGLAVSTAPLSGPTGVISNYLANSLNVGFNVVELQPAAGQVNGRFEAIARQGDASRETPPAYVAPPGPSGKRISWREIVK